MREPTDKEAMEITRKGFKLTMMRKNPFAKREQIWKEYNKFINSLSQETFDNNVVRLIQMLHYGQASCSEFQNAQAQLEVSLQRWPRLKTYSASLLEWIKQNRKEQGFNE